MPSINRVILAGHLGKDPALKTVGNSKVANFSLATSKKWTDKATGEIKQKTQWHNIVVWGRQAEACGKYLSKGKAVFVEGEIETRDYTDKQGQKKYVTEIVASNVQFLGGGNKSENNKNDIIATAKEILGVEGDDIPF